MRELGQGLALASELPLRIAAVDAAREDFQRYLLTHAGTVALRAEHRRGAAFAEHIENLERADAAAGRQDAARSRRADRTRRCFSAAAEQVIVTVVGVQQPLHALAPCGIGAMRDEISRTLGRRQVAAGIEQFA